jgi:hypothetical protein
MLPLPKPNEPVKFSRDGNSILWCDIPCVLLNQINTGALTSLCFVIEAEAHTAQQHLLQGKDLADLYTVQIMDAMQEFCSHFLCFGLFKDAKLVGFWDLPLAWIQRPLIATRDLDSPQLVSLFAAAHNRALAAPAVADVPEPVVAAEAALQPVGVRLSKLKSPVPPVKVDRDADDDDQDQDNEGEEEESRVTLEMPPAVSFDDPLEDATNRVELHPDDLVIDPALIPANEVQASEPPAQVTLESTAPVQGSVLPPKTTPATTKKLEVQTSVEEIELISNVDIDL